MQERDQLHVLLRRADERRRELLLQAEKEREESGLQERHAVQELQNKVGGSQVDDQAA